MIKHDVSFTKKGYDYFTQNTGNAVVACPAGTETTLLVIAGLQPKQILKVSVLAVLQESVKMMFRVYKGSRQVFSFPAGGNLATSLVIYPEDLFLHNGDEIRVYNIGALSNSAAGVNGKIYEEY